ncbi:MAG: hypothetical protein WCO06_07690 [Candidatus Roizmanbacteria bacterium]
MPKEAELGSAGEQPNRNILADWNGQRGIFSPSFFGVISFWLCMPKKTPHYKKFFQFFLLG